MSVMVPLIDVTLRGLLGRRRTLLLVLFAGLPVLIALLIRISGGQPNADRVLDTLRADGLPELLLELGDPGAVLDASTSRADLPAYVGPVAPVGGAVRAWGAVVAEEPEDAPLAGPSLAPYPQAGDDAEP